MSGTPHRRNMPEQTIQRDMPVAQESQVDPRLVFLARASARLLLVEVGELDLGEAYDGLVQSLICPCSGHAIDGRAA